MGSCNSFGEEKVIGECDACITEISYRFVQFNASRMLAKLESWQVSNRIYVIVH